MRLLLVKRQKKNKPAQNGCRHRLQQSCRRRFLSARGAGRSVPPPVGLTRYSAGSYGAAGSEPAGATAETATLTGVDATATFSGPPGICTRSWKLPS